MKTEIDNTIEWDNVLQDNRLIPKEAVKEFVVVHMPDDSGISDYDSMTDLEWAEYEFATIECDYKIHPDAAKSIRFIFKHLYRGAQNG